MRRQMSLDPLSPILVPRAHDPSGLWQGSRALAGPDFLSMRRAFVSCSRPIRFDEKSVNRGLPVLDQARALEPCHRPEGSWALGTRMSLSESGALRDREGGQNWTSHLAAARRVKLWWLYANLFFEEPRQLTKFA